MKIGEFDVVVTSSVSADDLAVEIWKRKSEMSSYKLGSVHIVDGEPIIHLGPDTENDSGAWALDYRTFRQIVQALDDFLFSIGHPVEVDGREP